MRVQNLKWETLYLRVDKRYSPTLYKCCTNVLCLLAEHVLSAYCVLEIENIYQSMKMHDCVLEVEHVDGKKNKLWNRILCLQQTVVCSGCEFAKTNSSLSLALPNYSIGIFTHLKLCLADAIHNFK